MDLNNIFDEYFKESDEHKFDIVIWEEDPVTFKEFVQSPMHMNFPPLSERQMDVFDFMFGDDPKKIFENEHYLSVLAWGKGCVTADTILEDAFTHEKYTVQELYKNNKSIYINCYDEKNKVSTIEKASIPWISGKGSIYRVTTESGKSIDVFEQHQFYTKNGWKQLCDLRVGDDILDDYDNEKIINNIVEEFKNNNKEYTEQDVKNFILNKFPIKGKIGFERNNNYSIYNKALYRIMGKDWRNKKFGSQKEKHPLWGTHQSEESRRKNSESNKISSKKFWKSERGQKLKELFRKRSSGKNGSMYGKTPPRGSGKCKYYKFKNLQGEEFYLQGTWEVKFAEFLNSKNIRWIKNKDRFPFIDHKGSDRTYCPDFKLFFDNTVLYVEIKGYVNEEVKLKAQAVIDSGKEYIMIDKECFMNHYYYYEEPILKFDKIVSIEYKGEDNYYDLEVDKYHNYLAHGLYNHNSGKDTVAYMCTLYVVHVLLCCKNPTSLFKGVHADYLDILNVAYSYPQAIQIFFAKLRNAVKDWTWLKNKYRYVDSGKSLKDDKKYETMDIVNIKQDMIIFPKKIRAMSKCSQQNAAEGTNLLVWIADEFSAFSDKNNKSNAMEMFDTLRTSSTTRFQNYGKGFVISFTRYKNDPILKLIDMYKDDINVYTDIASTFEVKPRSAFKGEWGTWNGIEMPVSFINDFEINPEGSKAKYLCQPPDAEDPWITEVNLLEDSFKDRVPMFEFTESIHPTVNGNMIHKDVIKKNYNLINMTYTLAGDIGLTNDRSVLTMFHDESTYLPDGSIIKHYVQDFCLTWIPNKKENRKVDINNIEYIIKKLIFEYKVPVVKIVFDHFSSSQLLDELANKGIVSQQFTLKAENFVNFKNLLYTGAIDLIKDSEVAQEMKRLVNGQRGLPDHPANEHDDRFRAICLAINDLDGQGGKNNVIVNEDGIFLKGRKKNISGVGAEGDVVKGKFHQQTSLDDDDIFNAVNAVNFEN